MYNSLILATWYKKKIKDSILSKVYADRNKIAGIKINDVGASLAGAQNGIRAGASPAPTDVLNTETIYQQYLTAFKKGVYNYIKEDVDPTTQERTPRKYFSGGATFDPAALAEAWSTTDHINPIQLANSGDLAMVSASLDIAGQVTGGLAEVDRQIAQLLSIKMKSRDNWVTLFGLVKQKLSLANDKYPTVVQVASVLGLTEGQVYSTIAHFFPNAVSYNEFGVEDRRGNREINIDKVKKAIGILKGRNAVTTFRAVMAEAGLAQSTMSRIGRSTLEEMGVIFENNKGEKYVQGKIAQVEAIVAQKGKVASGELPYHLRTLRSEILTKFGVSTEEARANQREANVREAIIWILKNRGPEMPTYERLTEALGSAGLKLEEIDPMALKAWGFRRADNFILEEDMSNQRRMDVLEDWDLITQEEDLFDEETAKFFMQWVKLNRLKKTIAVRFGVPSDWAGAMLVRLLYEKPDSHGVQAKELIAKDLEELKEFADEMTPDIQVAFEDLFQMRGKYLWSAFDSDMEYLVNSLTRSKKTSVALKKYAAVKIFELATEFKFNSERYVPKEFEATEAGREYDSAKKRDVVGAIKNLAKGAIDQAMVTDKDGNLKPANTARLDDQIKEMLGRNRLTRDKSFWKQLFGLGAKKFKLLYGKDEIPTPEQMGGMLGLTFNQIRGTRNLYFKGESLEDIGMQKSKIIERAKRDNLTLAAEAIERLKLRGVKEITFNDVATEAGIARSELSSQIGREKLREMGVIFKDAKEIGFQRKQAVADLVAQSEGVVVSTDIPEDLRKSRMLRSGVLAEMGVSTRDSRTDERKDNIRTAIYWILKNKPDELPNLEFLYQVFTEQKSENLPLNSFKSWLRLNGDALLWDSAIEHLPQWQFLNEMKLFADAGVPNGKEISGGLIDQWKRLQRLRNNIAKRYSITMEESAHVVIQLMSAINHSKEFQVKQRLTTYLWQLVIKDLVTKEAADLKEAGYNLVGLDIGKPENSSYYFKVDGQTYAWSDLSLPDDDYSGVIVASSVSDHYLEFTVEFSKGEEKLRRTFQITERKMKGINANGTDREVLSIDRKAGQRALTQILRNETILYSDVKGLLIGNIDAQGRINLTIAPELSIQLNLLGFRDKGWQGRITEFYSEADRKVLVMEFFKEGKPTVKRKFWIGPEQSHIQLANGEILFFNLQPALYDKKLSREELLNKVYELLDLENVGQLLKLLRIQLALEHIPGLRKKSMWEIESGREYMGMDTYAVYERELMLAYAKEGRLTAEEVQDILLEAFGIRQQDINLRRLEAKELTMERRQEKKAERARVRQLQKEERTKLRQEKIARILKEKEELREAKKKERERLRLKRKQEMAKPLLSNEERARLGLTQYLSNMDHLSDSDAQELWEAKDQESLNFGLMHLIQETIRSLPRTYEENMYAQSFSAGAQALSEVITEYSPGTHGDSLVSTVKAELRKRIPYLVAQEEKSTSPDRTSLNSTRTMDDGEGSELGDRVAAPEVTNHRTLDDLLKRLQIVEEKIQDYMDGLNGQVVHLNQKQQMAGRLLANPPVAAVINYLQDSQIGFTAYLSSQWGSLAFTKADEVVDITILVEASLTRFEEVMKKLSGQWQEEDVSYENGVTTVEFELNGQVVRLHLAASLDKQAYQEDVIMDVFSNGILVKESSGALNVVRERIFQGLGEDATEYIFDYYMKLMAKQREILEEISIDAAMLTVPKPEPLDANTVKLIRESGLEYYDHDHFMMKLKEAADVLNQRLADVSEYVVLLDPEAHKSKRWVYGLIEPFLTKKPKQVFFDKPGLNLGDVKNVVIIDDMVVTGMAVLINLHSLASHDYHGNVLITAPFYNPRAVVNIRDFKKSTESAVPVKFDVEFISQASQEVLKVGAIFDHAAHEILSDRINIKSPYKQAGLYFDQEEADFTRGYVGDLAMTAVVSSDKAESESNYDEAKAKANRLLIKELLLRPADHHWTDDRGVIEGLVGEFIGKTDANGAIYISIDSGYGYSIPIVGGRGEDYIVKVTAVNVQSNVVTFTFKLSKEEEVLERTLQVGFYRKKIKHQKKSELPLIDVYEMSPKLGLIGLSDLVNKPGDYNWLEHKEELPNLIGMETGEINSGGGVSLVPVENFSYDLPILGKKEEGWKGRIVDQNNFTNRMEITIHFLHKDGRTLEKTYQIGKVRRIYNGNGKKAKENIERLEINETLGLSALIEIVAQDPSKFRSLKYNLDAFNLGYSNANGAYDFTINGFNYEWVALGIKESGWKATVISSSNHYGFLEFTVEFQKDKQKKVRTFQITEEKRLVGSRGDRIGSHEFLNISDDAGLRGIKQVLDHEPISFSSLQGLLTGSIYSKGDVLTAFADVITQETGEILSKDSGWNGRIIYVRSLTQGKQEYRLRFFNGKSDSFERAFVFDPQQKGIKRFQVGLISKSSAKVDKNEIERARDVFKQLFFRPPQHHWLEDEEEIKSLIGRKIGVIQRGILSLSLLPRYEYALPLAGAKKYDDYEVTIAAVKVWDHLVEFTFRFNKEQDSFERTLQMGPYTRFISRHRADPEVDEDILSLIISARLGVLGLSELVQKPGDFNWKEHEKELPNLVQMLLGESSQTGTIPFPAITGEGFEYDWTAIGEIKEGYLGRVTSQQAFANRFEFTVKYTKELLNERGEKSVDSFDITYQVGRFQKEVEHHDGVVKRNFLEMSNELATIALNEMLVMTPAQIRSANYDLQGLKFRKTKKDGMAYLNVKDEDTGDYIKLDWQMLDMKEDAEGWEGTVLSATANDDYFKFQVEFEKEGKKLAPITYQLREGKRKILDIIAVGREPKKRGGWKKRIFHSGEELFAKAEQLLNEGHKGKLLRLLRRQARLSHIEGMSTHAMLQIENGRKLMNKEAFELILTALKNVYLKDTRLTEAQLEQLLHAAFDEDIRKSDDIQRQLMLLKQQQVQFKRDEQIRKEMERNRPVLNSSERLEASINKTRVIAADEVQTVWNEGRKEDLYTGIMYLVAQYVKEDLDYLYAETLFPQSFSAASSIVLARILGLPFDQTIPVDLQMYHPTQHGASLLDYLRQQIKMHVPQIVNLENKWTAPTSLQASIGGSSEDSDDMTLEGVVADERHVVEAKGDFDEFQSRLDTVQQVILDQTSQLNGKTVHPDKKQAFVDQIRADWRSKGVFELLDQQEASYGVYFSGLWGQWSFTQEDDLMEITVAVNQSHQSLTALAEELSTSLGGRIYQNNGAKRIGYSYKGREVMINLIGSVGFEEDEMDCILDIFANDVLIHESTEGILKLMSQQIFKRLGDKASEEIMGYYHELSDALGLRLQDLVTKDSAQLSSTGGIDFNADKLNLETYSEGGDINFKMDPVMLEKLQHAPGFVPVIINIVPMTDLKGFLGLNDAGYQITNKGTA